MKTQNAEVETRRECGHSLKSVVAEASQALALLDAGRLEEMVLSCEALVDGGEFQDQRDNLQLSNAAGEMAIFHRVLEATAANLKVMRRLREMRMAELYDHAGTGEYGNH